MAATNITRVFFLDRWHGWVVSSDAPSDEQNVPFYLLSTVDGAKHRRKLVLRPPKSKLADDYYLPSEIVFADTRHGWMFWHWHFMNSFHDALLSSSDGGLTWKRMPDPPGGGPAQFLSPSDGWMIGGPEDCDGVGCPDDAQLWFTHDGGRKWSPKSFPISKHPEEESVYLLAFKVMNIREEAVAAGLQTLSSDGGYTFVNCLTQDEGKTWQCSQFDALSAEAGIGTKHVFWSVHRRTVTSVVQRDNEPISLLLPHGL